MRLFISQRFNSLLSQEVNRILSFRIPNSSKVALYVRDLGIAVVTHSSPTSEVGGSNPGLYMGKLVVAYRWSAVSSTEL